MVRCVKLVRDYNQYWFVHLKISPHVTRIGNSYWTYFRQKLKGIVGS